MTELNIGTKISDRYTLKCYKGSGSFGHVWLAHDDVMDTDVAIKIYISLDLKGVEEFRSEYSTTQGITHPNLLTSSHFDIWEQRPFLVMKYCANGSTASLVGCIDEPALWQFIHDVAAGLNYLHNLPEPIIHQDIKPANILTDESKRYLITDFGISKKIRSTMRKQSSRAIGAGATAYMGPERFESDPMPIKASDLWSLGASIYELATGKLPFSGLGGNMQRSGADIPTLDSNWSKELAMVMQSCLAKDPWDRPTAGQLEEYSEAIINGYPAMPTWNVSSETTYTHKSESSEPDSSYIYLDDEEDTYSNKKRIWTAIGVLVAAIIILIIVWPSKKYEEVIVIPEDTVDTAAVEVVNEEVSGIPELQPKTREPQQKAETPTTSTQKNEESKVKKEDPKTDNNATLLKNALANGDYQLVQRLANQGYAAAYGPLAKFYLKNHDYQTAESYAKKAKSAGFSDGASVLNTLNNIGYYD